MSNLCSVPGTVVQKSIYTCYPKFKQIVIHLLVLNSPLVGTPVYLPLFLLLTAETRLGLELDPFASDSAASGITGMFLQLFSSIYYQLN